MPMIEFDIAGDVEYGEAIGEDYSDGELVPNGLQKEKKKKLKPKATERERPQHPPLQLPLQEHDFTK